MDDLVRASYAMITKGKNAEFCNRVSEECGFYVTQQDIERGSFSNVDDGQSPTYIEVVRILKGGGIKIQVWADGDKKETINLDRHDLPEGGVIFAP